MTVAPFLLLAVITATLWILALLALSVRRRVPLALLLTSLVLFVAVNAAVVARLSGGRDAVWEAGWLFSFLLAHSSFAWFAMAYLPGGRPRLRTLAGACVALLGCGLAFVGVAAGWQTTNAFQLSTDPGSYSLSAFPVGCLAVAFGEALACWKQWPHRRREASLVLMGTAALAVGGPVYGFELLALGHADFVGANLAVPLAAVLFSRALLEANPLAFHRRPVPAAAIPWDSPPGVYLLDEVRPAYAEAMFLSLAGTGPALAVVAPGVPRAELMEVEAVRLPPGERCASVLAATASEFFSRYPSGAVLIDDLSYGVTHSGVATVEAIRSVIVAMPKGASLVVSLAKLSPEEREPFGTLPGTWVSPPELHVVVGGILRTRLGSSDLLTRAAQAWGKRPQDLAVSDLPALLDYSRGLLDELRAPSDRAAEPGWERLSADLAGDLERYWHTPPTDLAARALASPEETLGSLGVVNASTIPQVTAVELAPEPTCPFGETVRKAFVASLGAAGEPVFRRVMSILQKELSAIDTADLPQVVRLADEVIADFGRALDVAAAGRDLVDGAKRLHAQLAGLEVERQ